MATVASWLVSLIARTQQYDAAVNRSARVTGDFERKVKGINVTTANWGNTQMGIAKKIVGIGVAVGSANAAMDAMSEGFRTAITEGSTFTDVWVAMGTRIADFAQNIPVAGQLGSMLGEGLIHLFDIDKELAAADALQKKHAMLGAATEAQIELEKMLADAQSRFDMASAHSEAEKSAVRLEKELRDIEQKYKDISAQIAKTVDDRARFLELIALVNQTKQIELDAARLENTPQAERIKPPNFPKERRFFDLASQGTRIPGPGTQAARDAAEKAAIEAAKDGKERTRLARKSESHLAKIAAAQGNFVLGVI